MRKDRKDMTDSEISLRKFLKNFGVTAHKIIEEKLKERIQNGIYHYDQQVTVNAEIKINELDLNHNISAIIKTPKKNKYRIKLTWKLN